MKTRTPPAVPARFPVQHRAAILLAATSLLFPGCATLDKIKAPSLKGDPSEFSVVVVKCESIWKGVLGIKTPQRPVSGVILSMVDSQLEFQLHGGGVADLIIFPDVPPGEYSLAAIEMARDVYNQPTAFEWYNMPGEDAGDYAFTVRAGELNYLGVVTVEVTQKSKRQVDFGLRPGMEAEIAAWEKFIDLYPGSSWANAAQKRISELKQ